MIQLFDEHGMPMEFEAIPLTPSAKASLQRILEIAHHGTAWYRVIDGEHELTMHYVSKDGTGYTTTCVWD